MLFYGVQQHESATCLHISPLNSPTPLGCHRAPSQAPCAIPHVPASYLFLHMVVYICRWKA